jgi:hypothetical protein
LFWQAFVETYWATWVFKDYPGDYCAQLKEVPASSIGSFSGANYVNIGKPNVYIEIYPLIPRLV